MLPIEVGRWSDIRINLRLCFFCNELGDEFHYLLTGKHFESERIRYLKKLLLRSSKCNKIWFKRIYFKFTILQSKPNYEI